MLHNYCDSLIRLYSKVMSLLCQFEILYIVAMVVKHCVNISRHPPSLLPIRNDAYPPSCPCMHPILRLPPHSPNHLLIFAQALPFPHSATNVLCHQQYTEQ